jgi:hypothetical protein
MYEIAIFNHLEIKVLVSPSMLTKSGFTSRATKNNIYGISQILPEDTFHIVGFEVTPRSVPAQMSCKEKDEITGYQVLEPGMPFNFTYELTVEESKLEWPHRFDHYLHF